MIWQAITSSNSCGSKIATRVDFKKGELTVSAGTDLLWSSMTNVDRSKAANEALDAATSNAIVRAAPWYFGYGLNKCVTDCVTLYADGGYTGAQKKLKPFPVGTGYYRGSYDLGVSEEVGEI